MLAPHQYHQALCISTIAVCTGSSQSTEITGWNWTYLTTSSAWNLQLGSRLQWLGPSSHLVVFNDRDCHQPVVQTSRKLAMSLDVQVCSPTLMYTLLATALYAFVEETPMFTQSVLLFVCLCGEGTGGFVFSFAEAAELQL